MYEATKVTLEHLFPLVVPGGLVVFDEYGTMPWAGLKLQMNILRKLIINQNINFIFHKILMDIL